MAWTPPTKHLKKKELLNAKTFYRKLSSKCNYVDDGTVFLWYVGLVQLIGDELRQNRFIRLPCLGDMALVTQRSRIAWAGRQQVRLGPKDVLRFYPKTRFKKYFREIEKRR